MVGASKIVVRCGNVNLLTIVRIMSKCLLSFVFRGEEPYQDLQVMHIEYLSRVC